MALAQPVVVTRTAAIATGYGLEDGANVRLVAPGDADGFGRALADVLGAEGRARALGARARETVESGLAWHRYVGRLEQLLLAAAEGRRSPRSEA
jgi:glycosyltransferase involved in cell wall biosynthesis